MKKKINRKGFTLVELLAVVVILLLISTIAISSISAAIERQNVKKDAATVSILASYAKLYFDEYKNSFSGSTPCVNVEKLISEYNLDRATLKVSSDNYSDDTFENGSIRADYSYNESVCPS